MNSLADTSHDRYLSKEKLVSYFKTVQQKMTAYLDSLDVPSLVEKPDACKFTCFDLILGQFRHIMYHVGFLHCCMNRDFEKLPEFIGLGPEM